ncbi:MAG: EFR1 family ferrodoxin [Sporomusaceae bacterium]|nr:EFR1 family ferrodoxin [Sporomusaceae bacterium]
MKVSYSTVKISYYSGTGNTAMAAEQFAAAFTDRGCVCFVERITTGCDHSQDDDCDLLLLLFPVHAFNAPEPVYRWLEALKPAAKTAAAVVSVSGGGDISPNTACRLSSIKRLTNKGYSVVYDTMLVMPCNVMVSTREPLAVRLLQVLPDKIRQAVNDIVSGSQRKRIPLWRDRLFSMLGELEKPGGRLWGRHIRAGGACNGCGCCVRNCPAGNIAIVAGRPRFGGKCHMCLSCLYGCRQKALVPGIGKFIILKEGYDLNSLIKKVPLTEAVDVDQIAEGYLWSGVKKYLLENR